MRLARAAVAASATAALTLTAACGGGGSPARKAASASPAKPTAATATLAAEIGGLDKLVAAARAEGSLNVIGLAPDWANYGEMIDAFSRKYGIAVTTRQPAASSREQFAEAKRLRGTASAPDVFDVSASVAADNLTSLAPYRVATWGDVPDGAKEPGGRYLGGYGGVMSIGYDARRVPAPKTLADLVKPIYRGKVALNGNPTRADAALNAVVLAALSNGGSVDDVGPGVDFFARLSQDGNLISTAPTPATIAAGSTPVVLDWDYTNVQRGTTMPAGVDWRVVIPKPSVATYVVQAINAAAPHPAAARLWQEFLHSDEGQTIWLRSLVRPVRAEAMGVSGTLDRATYDRLPAVPASTAMLTVAQRARASKTVSESWVKAIG